VAAVESNSAIAARIGANLWHVSRQNKDPDRGHVRKRSQPLKESATELKVEQDGVHLGWTPANPNLLES